MSSRRRQRRICARHKGHDTADDAHRAMRALWRNTGTTNLNIWRCKDCRKWHVGHAPQWLVKKREERRR